MVSAVAGLFALGLVVGLVLGGFGVAGARSGSPSATPSAPASPWPGMRHGGPGRWPMFGRFVHPGPGMGGPSTGMPGGPVHGQLTLPAPGGGYRTIDIQTGKVRPSAAASSLTVRSADGFSTTYAVDDDTLVVAGNDGIRDVKPNDTVFVLATEGTGPAHADRVLDLTALQKLRGGMPFGGMFPGFAGPPDAAGFSIRRPAGGIRTT